MGGKQEKRGRSGWRCRVGPRGQGGMCRAVARKAVAMAMRPGKVAAAGQRSWEQYSRAGQRRDGIKRQGKEARVGVSPRVGRPKEE